MLKKLICLLLVLLSCMPACAEETIVPFGETFSFETEIVESGAARLSAGSEAYETLNFDIRIRDHRGPMHFKKYYEDDYALTGTEAVVEIELTLKDYSGDAPIDPNRIILLTLQAEDATTASGYKMQNWELGGSSDIPMISDLPVTVFKRYEFDEDSESNMRYLVVHTFNGGVEEIHLMDMHNPKGENTFYVVYDELKRKSRGKAVTALQQRLKELNLLSGTGVDGVYGPNTAESVKAAQKLLGMEETGIATHEFQKALYKYESAAE